MGKNAFLAGLLFVVAFPLYAQNRSVNDSLKLQQLLKEEGEIQLNREALKELQQEMLLGAPKAVETKPWLEFDTTLPSVPSLPKEKPVLTLRPYTANTKYNWDPVYKKKIQVDKNTWRGDPFYKLTLYLIPSNWAKTPLDAGPRETLEQIEATGLRYRVTERANSLAMGSWQNASGAISTDLMKVFTKDFWNVKGRKRSARTLEILKAYGDSTTVLIRQPLRVITVE